MSLLFRESKRSAKPLESVRVAQVTVDDLSIGYGSRKEQCDERHIREILFWMYSVTVTRKLVTLVSGVQLSVRP